MIALAALALAAVAETTIQTIVRLPNLDAEDTASLRVICAVAPKRTEDFSRYKMLEITEGRPIRMTMLPDCVRLSVTVPGNDPLSAVSITESILRRAVFDPSDVAKALKKATADRRSYWEAALDPRVLSKPKTKREDLIYLYHRVFLPTNIEMTSAGADPAVVQEEWTWRTEGWKEPRPVGPILAPLAFQPLTSNPGSVATIEFAGPEVAGNDPALSTRLLVLIALGSGKGSSLFRVWRERQAWSYRQEALMWPTAKGWQPRLIAAMADVPDVEAARKVLLDDVDAWTESDRDRALGMAEGVLLNGVSYGPLWAGTGFLGDNLEDRTFFAAYWRMKTATVWNPRHVLDQMKLIRLDELKEEARDLLQVAKPRVLPTRP